MEYLILKYLNHSNLSISTKFSNMENKLYELIDYQNSILNLLDDSLELIESEVTINSFK